MKGVWMLHTGFWMLDSKMSGAGLSIAGRRESGESRVPGVASAPAGRIQSFAKY